ncbi:hypothetical protein J2X65_001686 [Ancylobacter sp. 3268]|uniref:hypothetical protein n=1 Tax=Ancylobacter sp. 3268 TaxID=2817752 RepID=UPI002861607D|nr:hypothetical protein [Ancylobacter sp. 3268]MDR6952331.1 hypothetical protein [Ancylobacter sp. 3268]
MTEPITEADYREAKDIGSAASDAIARTITDKLSLVEHPGAKLVILTFAAATVVGLLGGHLNKAKPERALADALDMLSHIFTDGSASPAELEKAPLTFTYRNWRGETDTRRALPLGIRFGSTEWHPEPEWLLRAFDIDRQAEREFALAGIGTQPHALAKALETIASCQWHWPEDDTSEDYCCGSPQEVVDAVYGWSGKAGEVVAVARGGIVEVTHCASLPPAPDADSDDDFWVEEATREAAQQKIDEELRRRAALTGGFDV